MKTGFIGLGLIGGSIARAVRHFYPDTEIIAYSRTRASVEQAVADGVVDRIPDGVGEDFADCDYIFLCAPGFQQRKISGTVEAPHPLFLRHYRRRKYQDRHPRKSYGTWYGRKLYRWTSHGRF